MTELSFEEVEDLVRLEKEAEQKLVKAREVAVITIENAQEDAKRILKEAEEQDYDAFFKERKLKIEEEKRTIEESTDEKIKNLTKLANKNKKKAIAFIASSVLEE